MVAFHGLKLEIGGARLSLERRVLLTSYIANNLGDVEDLQLP